MKVVIMQPSYLPYLGFFDLMKRCNVFVVYDDVKYTKNDWRNRNRIKAPHGEQWLTVPVPADSHNQMINMVEHESLYWSCHHLKAIRMNYTKAVYFNELFPKFREIMDACSKMNKLISVNMEFIRWIKDYLGIKCDIVYSSRIGFSNYAKTERLVLICKALGATEYISPNGSKCYLEPEMFVDFGIKLTWQDYEHPVYRQLWGDFISHLSIVDLLFNEGPKSAIIV